MTFMSRSGSKYLRSLLNQNHFEIHDAGETYNEPNKNSSEGPLFRSLSNLMVRPESRVGFHFRFPKQFPEYPILREWLEENSSSVDCIFLSRINHLKAAISQQNVYRLKDEVGKSHLGVSDDYKLPKLKVDLDKLISEIYQREQADVDYRNWAKRHFNTIEVYYEELCNHPEFEVARIFGFLGIEGLIKPQSTASNLKKATSDNLSDAIENYEEMCERLEKEGLIKYVQY